MNTSTYFDIIIIMAAYYQLIFDTPVKNPFVYMADIAGEARIGSRAVVDFGYSGERVGYIVGECEEPPLHLSTEKMKAIRRVVDKDPLFGTEEIELSRWMADFYFCSQGEAMAAILPQARRAGEVHTISGGDIDSLAAAPVTLSTEQDAALAAIVGGGAARFYLYGITGSGKTEVFLRTAERILSAGMSVIYLVPEISLTHQAAEIINARFGETAAMVHSGLTPSLRLAQWRRIRCGDARIVVGPRSAVFAPVKNLGLIVIDEEHDGSFKSGNTPRYNARQVAMRRCAGAGAALVMGSATPSAEAWHLMKEGGIKRLDLTARLSGGNVPAVKAVSLEHTSGCLSAELQEEIRKTAIAGRQTILFLNRRGFAYFYHCKECGYELTCKRCSVSLTWHKARGKAICHYCGYEAVPPSSCPNCGSLEAGFIGIGTEMVEEEVARRFPDLRVRRLDADTAEKKGGIEEALTLFRAGAIDILLGTQMVAKGLNFPGVRLVGVIFADTGLHLPDFRAAERTFSLIVQVAGRAGRFFPDGKVLVQTLRPFDPVIKAACALDVEGFFNAEFENRRLQNFPPYSRIIRIVARGKDSGKVGVAIARFFGLIRVILPKGADILGPSECPISLLSGNFRRQILLRGADMAALHDVCGTALEAYKRGKDPQVYFEVDVDPTQLL